MNADKTKKPTKKLQDAAIEYYNRKNRISHPSGHFDKAGRWYPADREKCDCCYGIREPSRAYPLSNNMHCRTIVHIANLYGVDVKELRKAAKGLSKGLSK